MARLKWGDLNERQQQYMEIIFNLDQGLERYYRLPPTQRPAWDNPPASVWRWLPYEKGLWRKLEEAGLRDQGTGSTFEALEKRKLIESSAKGIKLTDQGRALVRDAKGLQAHKALPAGTLQEWHWRALAHAYRCGEQGITEWPRGIGDATVRRLEDYKVKGEYKPLIAYNLIPCDPYQRLKPFSYTQYETATTCNLLCITPFGAQYYRENWARYREMYPDVDAPQPK